MGHRVCSETCTLSVEAGRTLGGRNSSKKKEELGEKTAHEAQIIRDSIAGTRTRGRMRVSLRERPAADDLASQATV